MKHTLTLLTALLLAPLAMASAAGEKLAIMKTMDYLNQEAAAGRREDFGKFLASVPDLPKARLQASDPATWKPVPYQAETPMRGVTLGEEGLFRPVMENNINYLLKSFSNDDMLLPFRLRAGQKNPPTGDHPKKSWDERLRGSNAGRFMMGAGETLRWIDHAELRKRLDDLIDGIEACREPNGYILAFPADQPVSEEPNYARAWFTHGLIEAGISGNPKAWRLLRDHSDWFNQWDLLPRLIYWKANSHQGQIASTRTYFSPVGKPEDLQVAEKYYVCDWWMKQLTARDPDAIWKYPLSHPHSYLITSFEAYLDHYRATGGRRYLDAAIGGWDLIRDHWQHVGGSMAVGEQQSASEREVLLEALTKASVARAQKRPVVDADLESWWIQYKRPWYAPGSYFLNGNTGETCGSVFWIKFNQRLLQLYPTEEKYAGEIEKSLYNVCLPNQGGDQGIRYYARMEGTLDAPRNYNTCCEGQGTRLFGSLPEYIYSTAKDGLYVNLFEPSTIRWPVDGQETTLVMTSQFPFSPKVELKISVSKPVSMKLRVRVPSWATADMPVFVNGCKTATGKPGTYAVLDRTWASGDTIAFTLPIGFKATRYTGADRIKGHDRYAIEYGPILLAAAGPLDPTTAIRIAQSPQSPGDWLSSKPGAPLHFTVAGHPGIEFMPCWDIGKTTFTTFPVISEPTTK